MQHIGCGIDVPLLANASGQYQLYASSTNKINAKWLKSVKP